MDIGGQLEIPATSHFETGKLSIHIFKDISFHEHCNLSLYMEERINYITHAYINKY